MLSESLTSSDWSAWPESIGQLDPMPGQANQPGSATDDGCTGSARSRLTLSLTDGDGTAGLGFGDRMGSHPHRL